MAEFRGGLSEILANSLAPGAHGAVALQNEWNELDVVFFCLLLKLVRLHFFALSKSVVYLFMFSFMVFRVIFRSGGER